jgi:Fe-S oxidoreductase
MMASLTELRRRGEPDRFETPEFLAHYYERRLRLRHAFAFGWIHIWSRVASYVPTLANFFMQTPGLRSVAKFLAGMEQKRTIPPFASETFQEWFQAHEPKNPAGPPVMLFPDTFNNFYHPETAKAAVEVLEDAGFRVMTTQQDVCCGRPLYDYGFLGMARRWLEDLIAKLRPQIRAGIPMVVLEPSCWAVFKDELTNILPPQNEDAVRLKELIFTLSDFLGTHAPGYKMPRLHRKALLHGHCHQKSLDRANDKEYGELFNEKKVLDGMGLDYKYLQDAGCCGMAGAFGFEKGPQYDVSVACGERSLLPDVRQARDEDVIIADGFSCREQVSQCTDRQALHLAQVLQLALHHQAKGPPGRPEAELVHERHADLRKMQLRAGAVIGGVALAWWFLHGAGARRRGRRYQAAQDRLNDALQRASALD